MTRRLPLGAALAAGALLVPVLAAPAAAACSPVVTASATLLQLELPTVPVPLTPPRNASASVRQAGPGSDSASGATNRLRLPVTGGATQVMNGTGEAEAEATVVGGVGRGSATTRVDGLRLTLPASPLTPDTVVTATVVQATASVDGSGTPSATVVIGELRVNDTVVPVPVPGESVDLPGGVGRIVLADTSTSPGSAQSASATALAVELTTGERVVLASAAAQLTGC